MRPFLALLMLGACTDMGPPDVRSGEPLAMNAAQHAARYAAIPEAVPCSEPAGPPRIVGHDAWSSHGRRVEEDFWFNVMLDTNVQGPGSIYVWMRNSNGRSLDLVVRPHGGEGVSREFEGAEWQAASTQARAAIVRRTILELAGRAAGTCGARLDSLDEEMASFERAFADLDAPWE